MPPYAAESLLFLFVAVSVFSPCISFWCGGKLAGSLAIVETAATEAERSFPELTGRAIGFVLSS